MPKEKRNGSLKATKVQLRLRPAEKAVIARAAELRQTTLSKFMLENAYQAAQQVLAEQVHFSLPPGRWKAFCQALDAPPRKIPALEQLLTEQGVFDGLGNSSPE
ncbi:MAG: DUF1778 domain-containing protein [Planctomycetes bacterium]|nr:DUF1778 domain-containing protein [Planctomycetota bacterium]